MGQGSIFVIGSGHLDVLSKASQPDQVIDRIGDVSIEVGGTACNIAINLASMGASVTFCSAMARSPYAQIVQNFLKKNRVTLEILEDERLPVAAFSAHIDHQGELISAITSAPVEKHTFTEDYFFKAMQHAIGVIVDCNLSSRSIDAAVCAANDLKIPAFVAAVSEPKSVRIADISGHITAAFMNRHEIRFLKEKRLPTAVDFEDMADLLNTILVVTCGEAGAIIVEGRDSQTVNPPQLKQGTTNLLGMGDMFMAATLKYHLLNGQTLHQAARNAVIFTRELANRRNCNLGRSGTVEALIGTLNQEAFTDGLTGVANRRAAESALEDAAKQSPGNFAVILFDIDHFKAVNDTHGHSAGDKVLAEVADILTRNARASDAVGRWGGEEFIVIMPNTDLAEAEAVAERMRQAIESRKHPTVPCTVSAGVAGGWSGEPIDTAVNRADNALYLAKHEGRNRVHTNNASTEAIFGTG